MGVLKIIYCKLIIIFFSPLLLSFSPLFFYGFVDVASLPRISLLDLMQMHCLNIVVVILSLLFTSLLSVIPLPVPTICSGTKKIRFILLTVFFINTALFICLKNTTAQLVKMLFIRTVIFFFFF